MANLLLAPAAPVAPAPAPAPTLMPASLVYLLRLRPRPQLIGIAGPVSQLVGYRPSDLLAARAVPAWLLVPDDLARVRSWLSAGGFGELDLTSRLRHREGGTVVCRHTATLSRGTDGTWVLAGELTARD